MKCPKCEYLGFETGDRCKNCGYDFSLAQAASAPREPELMLREPEPPRHDADRWLTQLEARLDNVRPAATGTPMTDQLASITLDAPVEPAAPRVAAQVAPPAAPTEHTLSKSTPALPLFHPGGTDYDAPLIKMPAAPRAPLSVRRTPERPKLRTVSKLVRRIESNPDPAGVFQFSDEPSRVAAPRLQPRVEAAA